MYFASNLINQIDNLNLRAVLNINFIDFHLFTFDRALFIRRTNKI